MDHHLVSAFSRHTIENSKYLSWQAGLIILILLWCALPAGASTRTALVIGNAAYRSTPLANPTNDANDMADSLKRLGFDVIVETNINKGKMLDAIDRFNQKLKRSDVGLFFFAGHGMQIHGGNYLIPVGVHIKREADVEYEAVNAGRVLSAMEESGCKVNIVILDACRDNPFKRSFRSTNRGLIVMRAGSGSFIAYATSPGSVAADGDGRNGIYTQHILKHMTQPGLTVEEVFRKVRRDVYAKTKGSQVPWDSSSLMGRVVLASSGAVIETSTPTSVASQGRLSVSSNITGAQVFVDGKFVGGVPLMSLELSAGSHRVQVKKDGYDTYRTNVEITSGRLASLEAYLTKQGPQHGRLFVDTTPSDAQIRILNIGPKYYQGMELSPGDYHVEVTAGGYGKQTRWVSLAAGEDKRISFSLSGGQTTVPSIATQGQPSPGQIWKDSVTGMEFVWVPGGCYQMGQTDTEKAYLIKEAGQETYDKYYKRELPRHKVCVDGFWMGKHEVTRGQFRQFVTADGYRTDADKKGKAWIFNKSTEWKWKEVEGHNWQNTGYDQTDAHPVATVSWNDAKAFAKWLSRRSGQTFGLPTEAQWEYAARAGTTSMRFWGNDDGSACAYANVADKTAFPGDPGRKWNTRFECNDGFFFTAPVGSFKPNPYGLYDMLGNVWEWCEDGYDSNAYTRHSTKNPVITSGTLRVFRGGGWSYDPGRVRAARRSGVSADSRGASLGFRLCLPQVRQ